MSLSRPPRRRRALWASALLCAAALLTGPTPALAGPARPGAPAADVDAALTEAVRDGRDASFFVVLENRADLAAARKQTAHAKAATAAYTALKEHARNSQRSLGAFLDKRRIGHRDFWIANTVQVTGDANLVAELARRDDVERLVLARTYRLDDIASAGGAASPTRTASSASGDATPEWGVRAVKADQVWAEYENRGEGIVIANVDSGVQYDHPDLVAGYRGNNGDGTFTHDHNFYDPSGTCPTSTTPCDNNGHGTHTMGTMAGRNGVGVAPGATWIAAKGCESSACSDANLLAAGQWILAPTDRDGRNPRPDLAPHIVNNSWSGGRTTFYQDIVEAWNAAGIFEAFAAGNDGDGTTCSTAAAPGAQAPAYGVGAYDAAGRIASFSGFGPSPVDGSAKPNIAAPGVDVTSTWPGSRYKSSSGTSMATPHVAGAVALLWSSAPSLTGDIAATRRLLDETAADVDDTRCGGTPGRNNVWGEGRLDVLAAVAKAPHTAVTVTGTVTDRATGAPLQGITLTATHATTGERTVRTGPDGRYRLAFAPGTYDFAFTGYGYATTTLPGVALTTGEPLTQDVALTALPAHPVTGTVLDVTGKPLAGAAVQLPGTPVAGTTSRADGTFTLPPVAEGSHPLTVTPAAPALCNGTSTTTLAVDGAENRTVRLPARSDASGTTCAPAPYAWIPGSAKVALSGDEDAETIALPFPVRLYGVPYTRASVTTDGLVNFLEPRVGDHANTALPDAARPNGIVAPLWDDLTLDKRSGVQTATTGTAGARRFAVVWNDVLFADGSGARTTFEAVFDEATGAVTFQYRSVPGGGASATVGIENQAGTDALPYAHDQAVLTAGTAIRFTQEAK